MELTPESYRLRFEKLTTVLLGGMSLWFGIGDVARGYGFFGDIFGALKLGLCILSGVICVRMFSKGILGPAILSALVVIVYNPFVSLDLDFDSWRAVNIATAVGFAWVLWQLHRVSKVMTPEKVRRMQLAEARADAIDEGIAKGDLDEKKLTDFMSKLTGGTPTRTAAPKASIAKEQKPATETVIHFVIKGPPPGVTRTAENTLITAKVARTIGPDGKRENKISAFAGADPLTFVEASSAIYWRDRIEGGDLTDAYVIDCLHAIGRHTFQNYLPAISEEPHPGEVAITTGLTQLSLHYAIAFLDHLGLPQSTVDWMAKQRAKGPSFERVVDYKKADSLKEVLADADIDPTFLMHVKRSVARTNK